MPWGRKGIEVRGTFELLWENEIFILDRVVKGKLMEKVMWEEIYLRKSMLARRASSAKVPQLDHIMHIQRIARWQKISGAEKQ